MKDAVGIIIPFISKVVKAQLKAFFGSELVSRKIQRFSLR
jgi:hypothetical protein